MSRRRYLLGYDISEPARLRRVHRCAKHYGYALQYSLFICDLSDMEVISVRSDLSQLIDHLVDRVVLVELGDPNQVRRFEFLGRRPRLPRGGPTIV